MSYLYRKANEMDKDAIFELYRMVMHAYISEIWGWDEDWQANDFSAHFNPAGITLVYKENELVGYSHIDDNMDTLFLRMIVIHPNHQRHGIGTHLLMSFITSGKEQAKPVSLEVFKLNTEAKHFYERHNFKIVDELLHSFVMGLSN
jgi:ribosomal protein S18 acetylase RimI-like enzyme